MTTMHKILCLAICTIAVGGIGLVQGYGTGAPATACVTMTPLHADTSAEITPPPFEVEAFGNTFGPNSTVIVFLSAPCGTETFGGFLLEARRADANQDRNEPLGSFENVAESRYVSLCGNGRQAVTHKNADPKTGLTFQWTAPEQSVGHIVFVATFATTRASYWVKVYSQVVRDLTVTSEPDLGGLTYPTPSSCLTATTQPPIPRLLPDSDCDSTKSCFSDCQASSCGFLVSWRKSTEHTDGIEFEIAAPTGRATNTWIAIGFSEDERMGNDKVVECVSFKDEIKVYTSYNTLDPRLGNIRNESPHPDDGVYQGNSSLVDGIFRCAFVVVTKQFSYINLDEPYYLLFAGGATASFKNTKLRHDIDHGNFPPVSPTQINFATLYRPTGPVSPNSAPSLLAGCLKILVSVLVSWVLGFSSIHSS